LKFKAADLYAHAKGEKNKGLPLVDMRRKKKETRLSSVKRGKSSEVEAAGCP